MKPVTPKSNKKIKVKEQNEALLYAQDSREWWRV